MKSCYRSSQPYILFRQCRQNRRTGTGVVDVDEWDFNRGSEGCWCMERLLKKDIKPVVFKCVWQNLNFCRGDLGITAKWQGGQGGPWELGTRATLPHTSHSCLNRTALLLPVLHNQFPSPIPFLERICRFKIVKMIGLWSRWAQNAWQRACV